MIVPKIITIAPNIIEYLRPSLSPTHRINTAPARQPISYIAVTKPCMVELSFVSGIAALNSGAVMMPDIKPIDYISSQFFVKITLEGEHYAPWSYPNSKNPVVDTKEIANPNRSPLSPAKAGLVPSFIDWVDRFNKFPIISTIEGNGN